MKNTRLFFHTSSVPWRSTALFLNSNTLQPKCCLHTSLPLLDTGNSSEKDRSSKSGESAQKPKMHVAPRVNSEQKHPKDYMMRHEIYTQEELYSIKITHRKLESWHDRVAYAAVRTLRFFFDTFTGYMHDEPQSTSNTGPAKATMTEKQWLRRIIFLESIAGVPGMVAGMSRHMKSLRTLRRDHGWINTLLSEAENERMHLLTFLELRQPGRIFRLFVLFGQGAFFNAFFLTYLISPRICHRFVGFLEEEAVVTYTRCIQDLDAGKLPIWSKTPAPQIAKTYWHLSDDAMMRDVLFAVRADEATHRQVNHKLADVGPDATNPFLNQSKEEPDPPDGKKGDTPPKT